MIHDNSNDNFQLEDDINSDHIKRSLSIDLLEWLSVTNDPWLQDKEVISFLKEFDTQKYGGGSRSVVGAIKAFFRAEVK